MLTKKKTLTGLIALAAALYFLGPTPAYTQQAELDAGDQYLLSLIDDLQTHDALQSDDGAKTLSTRFSFMEKTLQNRGGRVGTHYMELRI